MATVFYFAKICGINIANPDTQKLKTIARHAKNGNMTPQDAVMTAKSMNPNLDEAKSLQIVKEVFKSSNEALKVEEGSIIEELKVFLKSNYEVRLNDISEKIEIDGKELTDFMKNSIWGRACESLGKAVKKEYVSNLIKSDLICTVYNPIEDFIRENSHYFGTKGQIDKVIDSLIIANGAYNVDPEDRDLKTSQLLIKKWIVSWFAYMANSYSPLVLVLTGKQGCGKSHWLQNILPSDLMPLYAESNLMGGKDDYKLMHSKLLIMNDEFGGKTVSEAKDFKELVSKNEITYRKPYGEEEVKKKRIAVFCGTSNDLEVISDVTGNRRIIALKIMDVFWDAYNKVDKNALFIEAYELFKAGFEWRILKGDIEKLDKLTDMHKSRDAEEELILSMITPSDEKGVFMQSAEILSMIGEKHKTVRLNKNKLGRALNALGFESKVRKANGRTVRGYYVKHLSEA